MKKVNEVERMVRECWESHFPCSQFPLVLRVSGASARRLTLMRSFLSAALAHVAAERIAHPRLVSVKCRPPRRSQHHGLMNP